MYTLGSTEFNQIIETPNNQSVKKRLVLLDNGTIIDKIKSLTLYSSSSSQELQLGTTNMSYIDAEVESDLLLTNREVRLECGVELSDGSEEYIPMGVFTIQKPQGDIDFVKFKAHDNMQKFEKVYSSELTYPTTSDLVLDEICNMCEVMLSTPIENPIEITEKLQGYTCREVLGFIAGIHGKFACIDRLGTLNLRWYSEIPIDKQIGLIWAFSKSDDDFTVDKIEIAKDTETNYTSGSGFSAIYHSNPLATQEITDDLFAKLDGFTYNASTIDILDDIRLDIWDVIKVIYLDGREYLVPCMSLKQDFGQGSTNIQAFAKTNTENEYRYNGAMTNYVNRIAMELLLTNRIVATKVDAEYVNSVAITTENFEAKVAEIKELVVEEIDGKYATIDFANIDIANINKANIGLLFAEVGLLDRATIVDGHVTGFLDAVEINANKITAGTLMVDRLVFRGSENSIIYELNNITSKNFIPYPYSETTHIDNGIEWVDLGDGRIKASGTATADSTFLLSAFTVPAGTYTISGSINIANTAIQLSTNGSYAMSSNWQQLQKTIAYNADTYFNYCRILIKAGVTVEDVIFEPMLVSGGEVLPFEPFRERTQALTSETINGEVLTDRTITADKIIAKSITSNEIDVAELFANQAAIGTLIAQDAFIDAIETNRIVVGASNKADEAIKKVNKTVKSITMHYLATTASSGVTTSTSGWTTTVQQIDATKKYLWTYQTITYADNTTTDTSPVISGVYGNEGTNGVGITSVIPLYYLKSNATAPSAPTSAVTSTSTSSGVWTTAIPKYVSGYTYFTCTQTKYTDGTYKWSAVVADTALTDVNASVIGDNLIPYPYSETTHTQYGVTWTDNRDGTITANGTNTHASSASQFYFNVDTPLGLQPNTTYTFSGCPSGGATSTYRIRIIINYQKDGQAQYSDIGNGVTFTTPSNYTDCRIMIDVGSGVTVNNLIFKPMLEKGSVAHAYQPYVMSRQGLVEQILAENLLVYPYFHTTQTQNGMTFTDMGDGTTKISGTSTASCFFVFRSRVETDKALWLKKGTYTLSGGSNNAILQLYSVDGTTSKDKLAESKGSSATFTLTEDTKIQVQLYVPSGVNGNNEIVKPMLEVGTVAHPYREYSKGGTGLANNIYYPGTTEINGGYIKTGTVTAKQIDVDDLFAENINMTGKFISTGKAQLAPGIEEMNTISKFVGGKITLTDAQKTLYDFNKDGSVNLMDFVIAKNVVLGRRTIESLVSEFGYTIPQSNIQTVINSSNPQKVISINATNSWGRQIEAYFGLDGLSVPKAEANSIKAFGLEVEEVEVKEEITCGGDIYANYGLDTQVSLLGLQDKVNYLQPHGYSLIRYNDIGELTTTQKTYTLFNGRKMSDYGMLLITIGVSATDIRETMYIPTLVFSGSDSLPRTLYLECWTDNGATFNQVRIDYVSDTQIKAYLVTSTTKTKYLNIYGVKVDAALSGRSVDGYF